MMGMSGSLFAYNMQQKEQIHLLGTLIKLRLLAPEQLVGRYRRHEACVYNLSG
jgi:hypothetical protein